MDTVNHALSTVAGTIKNIGKKNIRIEYRERVPFATRKDESTRVRAKYPDRIPIVCEVYKEHVSELVLDRSKYLVPVDLSVAQFLCTLRKRINLTSEKALFLFLENKELPSTSETLGRTYALYKNEDGFLYITLSLENTFG